MARTRDITAFIEYLQSYSIVPCEQSFDEVIGWNRIVVERIAKVGIIR